MLVLGADSKARWAMVLVLQHRASSAVGYVHSVALVSPQMAHEIDSHLQIKG